MMEVATPLLPPLLQQRQPRHRRLAIDSSAPWPRQRWMPMSLSAVPLLPLLAVLLLRPLLPFGNNSGAGKRGNIS